MKYECLQEGCRKTFLYPAKVREILSVADPKPVSPTGWESIAEIHVCPFCFSRNIDEIHEDKQRIESIQSVKINEADAWIKQGYEVKDTYASTVTVVKYAVKQSGRSIDLKESQAAIDKDGAALRKDLKEFSGSFGGDEGIHP